MSASWQLSAVLSVISFLILGGIIPTILNTNPFTQVLAVLSHSVAPYISVGFGLIALLRYVVQRAESRPPARNSPTELARTVPSSAYTTAYNGVVNDSVHEAWQGLCAKATGASESRPTAWSINVLRSIEWKRFEVVTAAYFQKKTFRTELQTAGPDGGVDVKLFIAGSTEPYALVQCKAWNSQRVGVAYIRELLGVMAHQKVPRGIFVTTGEYTPDAVSFAKGCSINLITGEMLVKGILALPPEEQSDLLRIATEGDYRTPTCPSCGIKMVRRDSKRGVFWGCSNYPRCKQRFNVQAA